MKYNPRFVAAFFASQKIPPFVRELQFHTERKWRFDFAWIEQRVALECEGGLWLNGGHSRGSGVTKDIEKYNAATLLGWRILRCQPKELCLLQTTEMLKKMFKQIERERNEKPD